MTIWEVKTIWIESAAKKIGSMIDWMVKVAIPWLWKHKFDDANLLCEVTIIFAILLALSNHLQVSG